MSHPDLTDFKAKNLYANLSIDDEYLDEQLAIITGFWADGNLSSIVKHGKELLAKEIYDIRLSSYYLYSLWATEQNCSLLDILQAVTNLLTQDKSIWIPHSVLDTNNTPLETKEQLSAPEQLLQTCLGILFKRIEQRLNRFPAEVNNIEYQPCEVIACAKQLSKVLTEQYNLPILATSLEDIARFHNDACEEQQAESGGNDESQQVEGIRNNSTEAPDTPPATTQNTSLIKLLQYSENAESPDGTTNFIDNTAPANPEPSQLEKVAYSAPLSGLLNKIQIFEQLIQQEEKYKAAIVFEDIQQELMNFNPLRYLPELFSRYTGIRALFSSELHQLLQQNNTVEWQALKDYFTTSPNGFVQLELPPIDYAVDEDEQRYIEDESDFDLAAYQAQHNSDRNRLFEDD